MSLQEGVFRRVNDSNWCRLKLSDGTNFYIPNYTKIIHRNNEYIISEGRYSGQRLNITESLEFGLFDYSDGVDIKYMQNNNQLLIDGFGAINVVCSSRRIKSGTYYVLLPEHPVNDLIKENYLDEKAGGSKAANVWFPLLKENGARTQRYIHFGTISQGCVTVKFPDHGDDWSLLVKKLLQSRIRNGVIGTLHVI